MGDALLEVNLGGAQARALAMGESHTCALLTDDTVRCWGANAYGQLGLGDTEERLGASGADTPENIAKFQNAVAKITGAPAPKF